MYGLKAVPFGGKEMTSSIGLEMRTSAAKAVKRGGVYGTAEPVPFV
jgi:hypothetical protein